MYCRDIYFNILLKFQTFHSQYSYQVYSHLQIEKKKFTELIGIQSFSFNSTLIDHSYLLVLKSKISRTMTCWLVYENQLLSDNTVVSSFFDSICWERLRTGIISLEIKINYSDLLCSIKAKISSRTNALVISKFYTRAIISFREWHTSKWRKREIKKRPSVCKWVKA